MMGKSMRSWAHGGRVEVKLGTQGSVTATAHRFQFIKSPIAAGLGAAALFLGGCATQPPTPPAAAPAVVSLEEWLVRGDTARKEGLHEAARSAYRDGAKAYPTDKQPWLRLADDYFATGDYGNAVLAAQEAVQRDPRDSAAHSVLAVSGLRITAGSLTALREQSGYPVGSREEALDVTRRLREALGDPSLLPPAPAEPPAQPVRKPKPKPAPAPAAAAPAAAPAAPAPAPAAAPAPAPKPPVAAPVPAPAPAPKAPAPAPASGGNPLDKLK